jgi:dihydrofolate reductase
MSDRPLASSALPSLALIAAVARNGVIGSDNALPWRLPDDQRRFRAMTSGHAVIMGRKTWASLGKPLPNRENIVVTRQRGFAAAGAVVVGSLADALSAVTMPAPVFCIGGSEIYSLALPLATTMHLTLIDREYPGDTRFPEFDRSAWRETAREECRAPGGLDYAFVTLDRR